MDGNELIAKILKREGVEWIACFPSNPLIEAVAKEGIRPIAFRHERGAVMAADGFTLQQRASWARETPLDLKRRILRTLR